MSVVPENKPMSFISPYEQVFRETHYNFSVFSVQMFFGPSLLIFSVVFALAWITETV